MTREGEMEKPNWWPGNPYTERTFPMQQDRYAEIVPDPDTRTALSGCLGREFWDIASETILERYIESGCANDAALGAMLRTYLEELQGDSESLASFVRQRFCECECQHLQAAQELGAVISAALKKEEADEANGR